MQWTVSKAKVVAGWVLAALLAAAYLLAGTGKLTGAAAPMFEGWGYAAWFATLIGVLEVCGAIGLLVPWTTRYAVLGLTVIMLGAIYTHLANGETLQVLRPIIFLVVLWLIWWLRGTPGEAAVNAAATA